MACPIVGEQTGSSSLQSDDGATPIDHISEMDPEPQSYADVEKCPEELSNIWKNAMARELDGLSYADVFPGNETPEP